MNEQTEATLIPTVKYSFYSHDNQYTVIAVLRVALSTSPDEERFAKEMGVRCDANDTALANALNNLYKAIQEAITEAKNK